MKQNNMETAYCCPDRAQYRAGERVCIELHTDDKFSCILRVRLYSLQQEIECDWKQDGDTIDIGTPSVGNYGVVLETEGGAFETAFDVVSSFKSVVRYGFLSDFSPEDGDTADVEWMNRLHINTVQFYDWMYRHDRLISPTEEYLDPIGRRSALSVVQKKVDACKARGMRPFAYGAVYAATKETFAAHPDWAAYLRDGEPMLFAKWLYYMNISSGCGWSKHIVDEYVSAVRTLGFSGIHMDTYGFPKRIYNATGKQVMLEDAFLPLIDAAKTAVCAVDEENGVTFNAVNDWPTEKVSTGSQDAMYIEVWPPHDTYRDLYLLIRKAKAGSGKPVVLAAYMEPFQDTKTETALAQAEHAFRLTNAVIMASGGFQLVHGEQMGLLCDSYYVNYAKLRPGFCKTVVRYADFLVRYAPLLYDDSGMDVTMTAAGGINEDVVVSADGAVISSDGQADSVWVGLRESEKRIVLHLLNLTGNDADWNTGKHEPKVVEDVRIHLRLDADIQGVFTATPDGESHCAQSLSFQTERTPNGRLQTLTLPKLQYYSIVWIETE
jgi:dextranase